MSRGLKFRLWSYEDNEYVKLNSIDNGTPPTVFNEDGDRFDIEQYTGLKDKNGKEIYENDVVKCWDDENGKVYFCDITLQYRVKFSDGDDEDLSSSDPEVVGNIHEDEELLK